MQVRLTQDDSTPNQRIRRLLFGWLTLGLMDMAILVSIVGFILPDGACATPGATGLTITVHVYNYAQTPSTLLAKAEREAERILGQAGLNSVWLNCSIVPMEISENPCPEPTEEGDVRLRILSEPVPNGLHDNAYGFAILPALASVYSGSALRFAHNDEGEFEAPVVLGCAIAHEIGHLLLGFHSHSISGIMCAHWDRKHIRQALMGTMVFSPREARFMQAEMRKRLMP